LRQRILVILGIAVALLAVYTIAFTGQPTGRVATASLGAVTGQVQGAVDAKKPDPGSKTAAASPTPAGDTTAPAAGGSDVAAAVKVSVPESWGTDPFVRDWIMLNELANLSLKAITMGGDRAYALINNQILEEGDEISGKRIVRIESDNVTLEQGGRTFTLTLGE
jgi:hypothetical protein